MPYAAVAVANFFIGKSLAEEFPRTNLALQKLVFFSHATYYKKFGTPLVDDPAIAWPYGPVFLDLYQRLAKYGNSPVQEKIRVAKIADDGTISSGIPCIQEDDFDTKSFLSAAWNALGHFPVGKLVSASHSSGGAWFETVQKLNIDPTNMDVVFRELPRNVTIFDEVIRKCGR